MSLHPTALSHAYFKHRKAGCPSVSPLVSCNGSRYDSNTEMSEIFADSFFSVYNVFSSAILAVHQMFDGDK